MPRVLRNRIIGTVRPTTIVEKQKKQKQADVETEFDLTPPKPIVNENEIQAAIKPFKSISKSKSKFKSTSTKEHKDDNEGADDNDEIFDTTEIHNTTEINDTVYNTTEISSSQKTNKKGKSLEWLKHIDFSNGMNAYRVTEAEFKQFRAWEQQHPVAEMDMPSYEIKSWIEVYHPESEKNLYFPPHFYVDKLFFVFMPVFPGSKDKQFFMGSMGVVCAYQCVNNQSIAVVKVSEQTDLNESLEQEAYQILNFLTDTGKMSATKNCGDHFIRLTAATIKEIQPPQGTSFKEAFVMIEKMDTDLVKLKENHPNLLKNMDAIRFIVRSLAEGLACMHLAQPKPIAHGDFKPANVLCSPYTEQWLNLLLSHNKEIAKRSFIYVKMADFDAAFPRIWDIEKTPNQLISLGYASPRRLSQFLLKIQQASTEDDIWALGIIMLQLSTFHQQSDKLIDYMLGLIGNVDPKFDKPESSTLLQKAIDQTLINAKTEWRKVWKSSKPQVKKENSDQFENLIRLCLTIDEKQRIDIEQVLKHPFLSDLETKYTKSR